MSRKISIFGSTRACGVLPNATFEIFFWFIFFFLSTILFFPWSSKSNTKITYLFQCDRKTYGFGGRTNIKLRIVSRNIQINPCIVCVKVRHTTNFCFVLLLSHTRYFILPPFKIIHFHKFIFLHFLNFYFFIFIPWLNKGLLEACTSYNCPCKYHAWYICSSHFFSLYIFISQLFYIYLLYIYYVFFLSIFVYVFYLYTMIARRPTPRSRAYTQTVFACPMLRAPRWTRSS